MKLVDDHYPMPPNPDEDLQADQSPAKARKRTSTTARGKVKCRRLSSTQYQSTALRPDKSCLQDLHRAHAFTRLLAG